MCLKQGNTSYIVISLHDVPVCCCCCGQIEPTWSVSVLCICSCPGPLEGFVNKLLNSKEEGGGFFQVTQLMLCLVLNFPSCCFSLVYNLTVRDSLCLLTENLSLCPTVRVPIGLDSMLMNYHAKKKGFAKLFSFSFPKTPFPHSHIQVFFSQRGRSEVGNRSMPGNNKHVKGDVCFGFMSSGSSL